VHTKASPRCTVFALAMLNMYLAADCLVCRCESAVLSWDLAQRWLLAAPLMLVFADWACVAVAAVHCVAGITIAYPCKTHRLLSNCGAPLGSSTPWLA
jgi:hypothetical protein